MKLRTGILIRVVIYGSLIAYFGTRAFNTWRARQQEPAPSSDTAMAGEKRTITLPDGSTQEIHYVTPEQAKALFGVEVPAERVAAATDGATPR